MAYLVEILSSIKILAWVALIGSFLMGVMAAQDKTDSDIAFIRGMAKCFLIALLLILFIPSDAYFNGLFQDKCEVLPNVTERMN